MQNILLEIERCTEIEKVSAERGCAAAAADYACRRAALEWALAQVQREQTTPAAVEAQTTIKLPKGKK